MQHEKVPRSQLPVLLVALVCVVRGPDPARGLASERSSIERTYELTKYLEHQLREIKDTYLSYLGPPFSDPDFSPPRPNTTALSLPSAATRLDLWRGLENRARLAQNHQAYSVLLGAVKELAQATLCPYLQSSLLHFSVGLDGLLGSISGLMATLGYALPPHYYSAQTGGTVDASPGLLTPSYYSLQHESTVAPDPVPRGPRYSQNTPAKGSVDARGKEARKGQRGREKENERGPHRDLVSTADVAGEGSFSNNQRHKERAGKQAGDREGRGAVGQREGQREGRGSTGKSGETLPEEDVEGWRKRRRLLSLPEEVQSGFWNSDMGLGEGGPQDRLFRPSQLPEPGQRTRVRTRLVWPWLDLDPAHDQHTGEPASHEEVPRHSGSNGNDNQVHSQHEGGEGQSAAEAGLGREGVSFSYPPSPAPRHRSLRSVPSSLYTSTLHPPLSPFSLLYQLSAREGHTLLADLTHGSALPVLASLSAPPLPAPTLNDFSRKVESFWVLRELQSWLWRSAKDFNRLKKRLRA